MHGDPATSRDLASPHRLEAGASIGRVPVKHLGTDFAPIPARASMELGRGIDWSMSHLKLGTDARRSGH